MNFVMIQTEEAGWRYCIQVFIFSAWSRSHNKLPVFCFVCPQRKIFSRSICRSFLNYMWSLYSGKISFGMCSKFIIFWHYGKQMHVLQSYGGKTSTGVWYFLGVYKSIYYWPASAWLTAKASLKSIPKTAQ